jgi:spermidine synthase
MKIFIFVLALVAAPFLVVEASTVDTHLEEAKAIYEWVAGTRDGYITPKLELRREIPGDLNSPMGVYAIETIEADEDIVKVPWSVIIQSDDPNEHPSQLVCGTVRNVAREIRLGNYSKYAPYVVYLNGEEDSQIPSVWSKPGQELFLDVLDHNTIPPEKPVSWIGVDWFQRCNGDPNDDFGIKAALMAIQRADDAIMIPAYDNINHRNGNWTNTITEIEPGEFHATTASKTIKAGEQIYISYNMCEECGGRRSGYGTAEILRDYGFIEHFPQRWHYMEEDFQFDLDQIEDGKLIVTWDEEDRPTKMDGKLMEQSRVWFRWEIRRLKRIKNIDMNALKEKDNGIPDIEFETISQFIDANIVAMTAALETLGPSPPPGTVTTTRADSYGAEDDDEYQDEDEGDEDVCKADEDFGGCMAPVDIAPLIKNSTHYDNLEWEFDDLDYQAPTCNNRHLMRFLDFDDVEFLQTNYQALNFMRKESTDDTCMDLDNIVQICSNYRPQYHEYSTHGAGRFIKDVKRVIFIGGGDSMLLHEALKYPDLELVVGLEIDQTVVRKSFKYFHTSPHFEDERVEWWFGDATKSLLLLPKSYWGSFDLVLVDLSETVMSFSVTSELDVFDALSFLLNPVGVMVKNEHYHEKFAALFDYSAELNYESPVICNQVMVFGSNNVDFFKDPVYDHGVETKLYESMHTSETRYDLMHGYRKNIAPEEKCNIVIPEEPTTQGTAAGIIEVMDAENCSVNLDKSIVDIVKMTVEREGFTVIADPVFENEVGVVVLKEGFITARIMQSENYVGFDVNLWGMSSKIKSLRKSLSDAVGSSDVSSYKVVVGGMYGSSSWKEDQKIQGPKMKQLRNCEKDVVEEGSLDEKTASAIAFEEALPLTRNMAEGVVTAVFCGEEGKECIAYDVLKKQDSIKVIVPVFDCSNAGDFECERKVLEILAEQALAKGNGKRINLLAMDGSASFGMHQVVNSILGERETRHSLFEMHNIVVTWMADPVQETFRREFLDRYRKQIHFDPASRAEIVLQAESKKYELGVVSTNNNKVNYEYEKLQSRIENRLSSSGVKVELRNIHGALFKFNPHWDPKAFLHEEYDSKPGRKQFENQKPLGRQNIYQFVKTTGVETELDLDMVKISSYLFESLTSVQMEATLTKQYEDVGDGVMIMALSSKGYVTLVWDGREHISVNFFTRNEEIGLPEKFAKSFLASSGQKLQVGLRDDQPRGINHVVNFPHEMDPTWKPAKQKQYRPI